MPDFIARSRESIEATGEFARLDLRVVYEEAVGETPNVPAGTVVRQQPEGGTALPPGSLVRLFLKPDTGPIVSQPPAPQSPLDIVPNLIGLTRAAVDAVLLRFRPVYEDAIGATNFPPGQVVGQEPSPGTPLVQGSPVRVFLAPAAGPRPPSAVVTRPQLPQSRVSVPNLIGLTDKNVGAALEALVRTGLRPVSAIGDGGARHPARDGGSATAGRRHLRRSRFTGSRSPRAGARRPVARRRPAASPVAVRTTFSATPESAQPHRAISRGC